MKWDTRETRAPACVTIDDDIKDLISFAKAQGMDYKTIKLYNPWLRTDKLTVRRGELYEINIPL